MEDTKMKLNKLFAIIAALVLCLSAVSASADGVLAKIQAEGNKKIVMGTEATYPPYEYLDDNANFAGCDIWLAQQIAEALGVDLEIIDMSFDGIIPAVQAGNVDIGIAAFSTAAVSAFFSPSRAARRARLRAT